MGKGNCAAFRHFRPKCIEAKRSGEISISRRSTYSASPACRQADCTRDNALLDMVPLVRVLSDKNYFRLLALNSIYHRQVKFLFPVIDIYRVVAGLDDLVVVEHAVPFSGDG